MPKKKSVRLATTRFNDTCDDIMTFVEKAGRGLTQRQVSWCYDYAIIALYKAFEGLMLGAIVGAINNNPGRTIAKRAGIAFPKHLTDEMCHYLILKDGFFDFRGRSGLVKEIKRYLPDDHYILVAVKQARFKSALDKLCTLRNFAAHTSLVSKRAALAAIGGKRIHSAGNWLKKQDRLKSIANRMAELANDIGSAAPY